MTGDKPMSDFEEQTFTALRNLFEKVEILRQMDIRQMLEPDRYYLYEDTLQAAYDALTRVEDALTTLGMKDPEVFTDTIKVDDLTLRTLVSHLESINLSATDLDTKGIAFEQFMDGFFKGDFGQCFTPRPIIDFAVKMLKPTPDDLVLDPACGSGS